MDNNATNLNELAVEVLSSTSALFRGKAKVVSSFNKIGPFDILPMHENFISLIRDKIFVIGLDGVKKEIPIERGLLEVSENKVRVFVGV